MGIEVTYNSSERFKMSNGSTRRLFIKNELNELKEEDKGLNLKVSPFNYDYFFDVFNVCELDITECNLKMDRRTALYKRSRKTSATDQEYIEIDCQEANLPHHFRVVAESILKHRTSCIDCFKLILNSVVVFYWKVTFPSRVQQCVINFFHQHVVFSFAEFLQEGKSTDGDNEKMQLKMEVICLLELFIAKILKHPLHSLQIIENLRMYKYLCGSNELLKFVDECLVQRFGDLFRDYLPSICEKFDIGLLQKSHKLKVVSPRTFKNPELNEDFRIPAKRSRIGLALGRVPKKTSINKSTKLEDLNQSRNISHLSRKNFSQRRDNFSTENTTLTSISVSKKNKKTKKTAAIFVRQNTISKLSLAELSTDAGSILKDSSVGQYKNRMEDVRIKAKFQESHSDKPFYGLQNTRTGLFDDDADYSNSPAEKAKVSKRTSDGMLQKSRSGRTVKASEQEEGQVAHTLLNTNNRQPLKAFKAKQVGDMNMSDRLRKFATTSNSSQRRRMENYKKSAANLTQNNTNKVSPPASENSNNSNEENVYVT